MNLEDTIYTHTTPAH